MGHAEVNDDGLAATVEEDVAGLEVAVGEAGGVHGGDGVDDLNEEAGALLEREAFDGGAKVDALDPLHDEEGVVAVVEHGFEDAAEVGVGEPGHRAGLVHELVARGGVGGGGEEFDGDASVEAGVGGFEDTAHAAFTGEALEAVATGEEGAGEWGLGGCAFGGAWPGVGGGFGGSWGHRVGHHVRV